MVSSIKLYAAFPHNISSKPVTLTIFSVSKHICALLPYKFQKNALMIHLYRHRIQTLYLQCPAKRPVTKLMLFLYNLMTSSIIFHYLKPICFKKDLSLFTFLFVEYTFRNICLYFAVRLWQTSAALKLFTSLDHLAAHNLESLLFLRHN